MKTLTLLVLLVTSQFAGAMTKEQTCLAKNIYLEARGVSKKQWSYVASVALNRSKKQGKSLCEVVRSRQYTSSKLWNKPIKETDTYKKIEDFVLAGCFAKTKYMFFSTKGRNLQFTVDWVFG